MWPALVAAAAAAAHLAVAVRGDRFVATVGEARLAAATFAARGTELGDITLPAADRFAVRQFAVVETLLPTGGLPVVDAARWAALAFGFLSVVLLWPVLRALGAGPVPAAVAAGLIGVVPPVVVLHAGITAAAPATAWLVAAAALAASARRRVAPAAVAAGIAALTAPLAAAALLVLAAHLAHDRVLGGRLPPAARLPAVVALGATAVGVATAAAGNGPLAGIGGPVVGLGATLTVVAVGVVLSWLAWTQHPELRPALTPAVLLLAVALVPGAARSAALLLVLPFLAVVFALLAEPVVATLAEPQHGRPGRPGHRPRAGHGRRVARRGQHDTHPADRPGRLGEQRDRPERGPARGPVGPRRALGERHRRGTPARPRRTGAPGRPDGGHGPAGDRCRRRGRAPLRRDRHAGRRSARSRRRSDGGVPGRPARPGDRGGRAGGPGPVRRRARAQPVARAAAGGGRSAAGRAGGPAVVLVLADLASPRRLAVEDFPVEPLEPPYALRRHVLLERRRRAARLGGPQQLMRTWFAGQQRPFVPNSIEVRGEALLIGYPAPTPTGLIAG